MTTITFYYLALLYWGRQLRHPKFESNQYNSSLSLRINIKPAEPY